MNEREALVILNNIAGIGPQKMRVLISAFGSGVEVLQATKESIRALPRFGEKLAEAVAGWQNNILWQKDLELIEQYGVKIVLSTDEDYPKHLRAISDHPLLLYVLGSLKGEEPSIAIVGTRTASDYGKEQAKRFGRELAGQGVVVVSGLARGIDTAAHVGALEAGRTVAVIGSGLARLYPAENSALAEAISKKGAVVSEFAMMVPPDRQNFPRRNRIVSGMTQATCVIEAPVKSGAMITASKALEYKRDLFALPGLVDSENYRGNHQLIKTGQACLIENPDECIYKISKSPYHEIKSSVNEFRQVFPGRI